MGPDTLFNSLDPYHATMAVSATSDDARIAKLKEKSENLDAIKKAVEDAAAVGTPLWISYLFLLLYIAIASAAVTHTDLLLERPVDLPFLNIKLPLKAFFILAPLLFLVSHTYTMAHFALLSDKAKHFHLQLRREVPDPSGHALREGLRRQLPINIFVQFLAGPEEIREGPFSIVLWATAWTTLVAAPVFLLLLLQLQFLPYHDSVVTWWHRFAVLFDLAIIQWLWMRILSGRSQEDGHDASLPQAHAANPIRKFLHSIRWRSFKAYFLLFSSLIAGPIIVGIAFFTCWIATFPSEWERFPHARLVSYRWQPGIDAVFGSSEVTREGEIKWPNSVEGLAPEIKPARWPFNTLHLRQFDIFEALKIDDPAKVQAKKYLIDLRNRHLERADLAGTKLPRANLDGAFLQGASLSAADMAGSSFEQADLDDASLRGGNFASASFNRATLRGANLDYGRFPASSFANAALQGASIYRGKLTGSMLSYAHLEGARLARADLTDAYLSAAHLQLANFEGAKLYVASLGHAQLDGASFQDADLAGAMLYRTKGVAPNFRHAKMWRSRWDTKPDIQLAELSETTFRPSVGQMEDSNVWMDDSYRGALFSLESIPNDRDERKGAKAAIEHLACEAIPEPNSPYQACKEYKTTVDEAARWQQWSQSAQAKDETTYRNSLHAVMSSSIICDDDPAALYIVRGMINQDWPEKNATTARGDDDEPKVPTDSRPASRISALKEGARKLVEDITRTDCAVSRYLTDNDRQALEKAAIAGE